jgi:hypothetical protein
MFRKSKHAATSLTDLTIISDRTSAPPILCMAQYFGQEKDLCGGLREVKPWIIYMFDFMLKCWHMFLIVIHLIISIRHMFSKYSMDSNMIR